MPTLLLIDGLEIALADHERHFTLEVPHLQVASGEVIGLTGASGTGKTLLLETLGLLRRPGQCARFVLQAGPENSLDLAALWSGAGLSPQDVRGARLGFVPQSGGLLPFLTVEENIALSQRISGRQDGAWCDHLAARLGLAEVRRLKPGALSIGQRQRVAIARALAHRPDFVIADEPTAALDPDAATAAMGLLIDMATSGGAGVVISSHDLGLLDQFPMRRVALGLVSEAGSARARSRLFEVEPAA